MNRIFFGLILFLSNVPAGGAGDLPLIPFQEGVTEAGHRAASRLKDGTFSRVVVAPFKDRDVGRNTSAGFKWAEALEAGMAAQSVTVVPSFRLAEIMTRKRMSLADLYDSAAILRLGKFPGFDAIVIGSYSRRGRSLQVEMDVIHARAAELLLNLRQEIDAKQTPAAFLENVSDIVPSMDRAQAAADEREYGRAREWCLRVLWQDSEHAAALDLLGQTEIQLVNFSDAFIDLNRALDIRRTVYGAEHPDVGESLSHLGALYSYRGEYDEAERLMVQSILLTEKAQGRDHPKMAGRLSALGGLYKRMERNSEALAAYREVLGIQEKIFGPAHPKTADALFALASVYNGWHEFEKAEPHYLRAMKILEKTFGRDHPKTIACLTHLVRIYDRLKRYEGVEPLFRRMVEHSERLHGPYHAEVATYIEKLARLYDAHGRDADARVLFERAVAVYTLALGPDHPDIAPSLNDLAILYARTSRTADAVRTFRRALAIAQKTMGDSHPMVIDIRENIDKLTRK